MKKRADRNNSESTPAEIGATVDTKIESSEIITESPEFPYASEKIENKTELFTDEERKEKEIDNSTVGGF